MRLQAPNILRDSEGRAAGAEAFTLRLMRRLTSSTDTYTTVHMLQCDVT